WKLWGAAKPSAKSGADGTAMIRLERVKIADGPGDNRLAAELSTSMYLGDKWEHLFHIGEASVRAYGDRPLAAGRQWLEMPRGELWVF
ncbi:MAG TPA: ABC transporter ATP-binding protein, partial [Casimicrobiaceae bacterium]|nr:ABC transporter ATP-binding protein [Casimicrobiaceae bacterium]